MCIVCGVHNNIILCHELSFDFPPLGKGCWINLWLRYAWSLPTVPPHWLKCKRSLNSKGHSTVQELLGCRIFISPAPSSLLAKK